MGTVFLLTLIIWFTRRKSSATGYPPQVILAGRAINDYIKETLPGKGNEIQLTDAVRMLIKKEVKEVYAYKFRGKRYDAGDKLGYVKAIVDFALKRDDLKGEIGRYLRGKR